MVSAKRTAHACDYLRLDHREVEVALDRLIAALKRLQAEHICQIQAEFAEILRLLAIHFEAEEKIFYPAVRPRYPDLLATMDRQHEGIHELESLLQELLSEVPDDPDSRWLDQLRSVGIAYHDLIQHHIVDEEEQLFRIAAACVRTDDQLRLAEAMRRRRAG